MRIEKNTFTKAALLNVALMATLLAVLLMGLVTAFKTGAQLDAQEKRFADLEKDYDKALLQASHLSQQIKFMSRMSAENRAHDTVDLVLDSGIKMEIDNSHQPIKQLVSIESPASYKNCQLEVEAAADLASESVWFRPLSVICGQSIRPVKGDIRTPSGSAVRADVSVVKSYWYAFNSEIQIFLTVPAGQKLTLWQKSVT